MPDYPSNYQYDSATETLSWDGSPDAVEFEIYYAVWDTGNYQTLYTGSNTSCSFNVGAGEYAIKGKQKKEDPGSWDPIAPKEKVTVT
jgi:hypothetical protein